MIQKKVAFIGSVGSGKTTLIKNLSTIEILNTDVKSTQDIGKEMTTVGMDYGEILVDNELKLGLYGVPGQRKFSFMWDFVKQGLWAVVILIKNNSNESISELDHLIDYFEINDQTPCLIAITHSDVVKGDTSKKQIKKVLDKYALNIPIYSINSSLKENGELIFRTLVMLEETRNNSAIQTR